MKVVSCEINRKVSPVNNSCKTKTIKTLCECECFALWCAAPAFPCASKLSQIKPSPPHHSFGITFSKQNTPLRWKTLQIHPIIRKDYQINSENFVFEHAVRCFLQRRCLSARTSVLAQVRFQTCRKRSLLNRTAWKLTQSDANGGRFRHRHWGFYGFC